MGYSPSGLLEDKAALRETAFSRWLAPDFHQAAVDFQRAIGLWPLYMETNDQKWRRTISVRYPDGVKIAAHSGRDEASFAAYDEKYRAQGLFCLSLHIHPNGLHSAVWGSSEHREALLAHLALYGISEARLDTP